MPFLICVYRENGPPNFKPAGIFAPYNRQETQFIVKFGNSWAIYHPRGPRKRPSKFQIRVGFRAL